MYGIDSVTPSVCGLMGVAPPRGSTAQPIKELLAAGKKALDGRPAEKALLYAPDAMGEWLFQRHRDEFGHVLEAAPIQVQMRSMTPSKTPVCYGSMFTGLKPEGHGIRQYEKRVLSCDTMFDALSRAGKSVAIVAVKGSSIDLIFRGRPIDYYTEEYDPEVEERVLALLGEGSHDLILAYHQGYDDRMHGSTPTSPEAIEAFRGHLETIRRFSESFERSWGGRDRVIAFLPDHGTHVDPDTGKGTHGSEMPEDMEVRHFWGIRAR
ncbi:alkaline phosphatase family protein [Candidatus Bathyarchaeota archaeon]|nr:alkaline phosphatase family protein [Candidatus Bathyarchaeota archaeon]